MAPVALAFAILDVSSGVGDLSIVLAAHTTSLILFLVIGGAVADRFPRRRVLIAANLGSGVTQGCVAALLLTGHYSLSAVAILELCNGTLTAFTMPALRAVVVDLLERDQLRRANSLLGIMRNSAKIAGPTLAGLLAATVGGGTAIAVDAATFVIAACAMSRMRGYPNNSGGTARPSLVDDIRAGWTAFRSVSWVWPVAVSYCVVNVVQAGSWQVLGPALTKEIAGEATWGLLLSIRGIGLVLASLLAYKLAVRYLLRLGQSAGVLGAIPLIVLGLHASRPVLVISALVAGIGVATASLAWETSLQEHIPGPVLSRVSSFDHLLSYVAIPLGMLSIGPLVSVAGGFTIVLAAGVIYFAAVAAPLAVPAVRNLPHSAT